MRICFPVIVVTRLFTGPNNKSGSLQLFCLLLLVCTALPFSGHAAKHKVRVNDSDTARDLVSDGATVLVDYGAFQLLEADDSTVALASAVKKHAEVADDFDVIELNARHLNTRKDDIKALRGPVKEFAGKRLHLVQFVGPIKPEWQEALKTDGLEIITYIPNNTYLVYGNFGAIARMQARAKKDPFVQWESEFADDYKIHPQAKVADKNAQEANNTFAIQMVEDANANAATIQKIHGLKLAPIRQQYKILNYLNVVVALPPARVAEIAKHPEVVSIQPYYPRHKLCERQAQIMAGNLSGNLPGGAGYLTWLTGKGFTQAQFNTSAFVVDVSDSGIDNGSLSPGHFGLYVSGTKGSGSRVAYTRLEGTGNFGSTTSGCDGHGNLNAHIIGGYDNLSGFPFADANGYHYGLGICPFVKVASSVIFDPNTFTDPVYADLASRAYRDGARISNNSWGSDNGGAYDTDSQAYDALVRDAQPTGSAVANSGNQELVFVFAAGNAGPGTQTVGSPGTAKNVITVGAGENVQAFGGSDWSAVSDTDANSANDLVDFSSRGPCLDSRVKPDICAPGTHVSGGVAQVSSPAATGTAISCFNGEGVSGGNTNSVDSNFFPSGQEFYTASSGTSHSTPGVAGACALIRQFFINSSFTPPSPAMTKAFLMNSARYMTGNYVNDTLPSNKQGMGEVNLGTAFDGVPRIIHDQESAQKFTATGQTRTVSGFVSTNNKPFRVTLAWTDAPGTTTGNAYKNNLDLTVSIGGNTYKGNVFSSASSITGGSSDVRNNVESVFLPAGVTGPFIVTVTGANINSDGVPNQSPSVDQDFALIVYNGVEGPVPPVITSSPQSAVLYAGNTLNLSVGVSGSSPLSFQWRKDNSPLFAATNSTYSITNIQKIDAGNFDVIVTNTAGKATSAIAVVTVNIPLTNVLAQWNFNSSPADGNTATGSLIPSVGNGTATAIGGVTQSYFGGGGADLAAPSDNTALGLASFPAINAANKTAGAQFAVSTAGKQNVVVRWDHRVSNTGSKYTRLQYSTNGVSFVDFPTPVVVTTPAAYEAFTNDLFAISGVNNNPNFAFRLVTEWESTAINATNAAYVAASVGSTYAGSGTMRFDMVTVYADPYTAPPDPTSSLNSINYGGNGVFQFSVSGAAGNHYAIEVSTNLSTWTPLSTNTAPFVFSVTNAPGKQLFYRAAFRP